MRRSAPPRAGPSPVPCGRGVRRGCARIVFTYATCNVYSWQSGRTSRTKPHPIAFNQRVQDSSSCGRTKKGALQNRHLQRALFVGKIDCGREECGKYGSKPCGIDIRNQTPAYLPASSVENIPLLHFTLSFSQTHGFSSVRVPASSTTFSGQTPWPAGTTRRGCSPCPG